MKDSKKPRTLSGIWTRAGILALILVLTLSFVLGGCGSKKPVDDAKPGADVGDKDNEDDGSGEPEDGGGDANVTPVGEFPIVKEQVTVTLAVPQNNMVEDFKDNEYTKWLEEKTNINIEFEILPAKDADQKVQLDLAGFTDLPDAYIGLGRSSQIFTPTNVAKYGEEGQIIALNDLMEEYGDNIKQLWEDFEDLGFKALMTSADGNMYFMPGFSDSDITRYSEKMWVNTAWMEALDMKEPETTEDFYNMLKDFKEKDPNGNNKQDEIPLAGTETFITAAPYNYLINAFVYNDPNNTRMTVEDGKIGFAPITDEWREAMKYIHRLTSEELLSPLSFTQDDQQLRQMTSDPNDILGAFTSLGIQLVTPEATTRYSSIGPIKGPDGTQYATFQSPVPSGQGVITSTCENPEALFRLFDLMLSEEACLMGRYGIKGVHWDEPKEGQESIYGTQATVDIIEQIWGIPQKFHWGQSCPYISRPKFSNNVGWNGDPFDTEYINAQASKKYKGFEPEERIAALIYSIDEVETIKETKSNIEAYIKETIAKFAVGEMDINDDKVWDNYVKEYTNLGLDEFLSIAQEVYDRMK